jgi:hypothetical protein
LFNNQILLNQLYFIQDWKVLSRTEREHTGHSYVNIRRKVKKNKR